MNRLNLVLQATTAAAILNIAAMLPAMAQVPGNYRPAPGRPATGTMMPPTVRPPAPGVGMPGVGRPPVPGTGTVPPNVTMPGMPGDNTVASSTTFLCGQSGSNPATLVQVSGRTLQSPLIVWATTYFGTNYTPQQRCQMVSARLSNAVAQNGGRLSNLRLATGTVNNETVVCVTNNYATCSANNMLFTLRPENANNSQDVLARLMQFGRLGGGNAVYESGGFGGGTPDSSIDLEEAVNLAIQEESGGIDSGYGAAPVYTPDAGYQGEYVPEPSYAPDAGYAPEPNYYPGGGI